MTVPLSELVDPEALARMREMAAGATTTEEPSVQEPAMLEEKATGVMEHKGDPGVGGAMVLEADDDTGRVVALVSVTGIEDRVKDVIEPGAYAKTMAEREPIGVWSHDDKTWVARTEAAEELPPGHPLFRDLKTMDGKPWPAAAGAVKVEALFNLDTPHGKAAYSDVKFFQGKTGWSIGYRATKAFRNPKTGVRHIKELEWYEYSPVMSGAATQPMTLAVKSFAQPVDPDDATGLADEALVESLDAGELARYTELKASLGLEVKDVFTGSAPGQTSLGFGHAEGGGTVKAAGMLPCPKCGSSKVTVSASGAKRCGSCGAKLAQRKDDDLEDLEVKDRVRTPGGERQYGQPIGTVIVPDHIKGDLTDSAIAGMIGSAKAKAAKGDESAKGEVRMLTAALALPPEKRRAALTSATNHEQTAGLTGRLAAAGSGKDKVGGSGPRTPADVGREAALAAQSARGGQPGSQNVAERGSGGSRMSEADRAAAKAKADAAGAAPKAPLSGKLSRDESELMRGAGRPGDKFTLHDAVTKKDVHVTVGEGGKLTDANGATIDHRQVGGRYTVAPSPYIKNEGEGNGDGGKPEEPVEALGPRARALAREHAKPAASKPPRPEKPSPSNPLGDSNGNDQHGHGKGPAVDLRPGLAKQIADKPVGDHKFTGSQQSEYDSMNHVGRSHYDDQRALGRTHDQAMVAAASHDGVKPAPGADRIKMPDAPLIDKGGDGPAADERAVRGMGHARLEETAKGTGPQAAAAKAELARRGPLAKPPTDAHGRPAPPTGAVEANMDARMQAANAKQRGPGLQTGHEVYAGDQAKLDALPDGAKVIVDYASSSRREMVKRDGRWFDTESAITIGGKDQGLDTNSLVVNYALGREGGKTHGKGGVVVANEAPVPTGKDGKPLTAQQRAQKHHWETTGERLGTGEALGTRPSGVSDRDWQSLTSGQIQFFHYGSEAGLSDADALAYAQTPKAEREAFMKAHKPKRHGLGILNRRRGKKGLPLLADLPTSLVDVDFGELTDDELEAKVYLADLDGDVQWEVKIDTSPLSASRTDNWVARSGGLPPYIRGVVRGIMKSGKTEEEAIPIAIGRIKRWAAGGDGVHPDTQAKAAKALAQWEALKAKNGAKSDSALLAVLERKALAVEEAWDVILDGDDLDDLSAALDSLDYGSVDETEADPEGKSFPALGDEVELADPDEVIDLLIAAAEVKQAASIDELLDRRAALEASRDFR